MRAGLTTSLALHVAVIGFGLVSLSSPRALEVASVESLPIDIVPVEEFTQSVRGDREAPVEETPAPVPTTREEVVEEATQVGDNSVDLETPPTPEPSPREVEAASAPPPTPEPVRPAPVPEPEPAPQRQAEPEPVPATERAPEPQPQQEVAPDPVPETAVAEAPADDSLALPTSAPTPQSRPQPPQAQTAQAPERREPERQPQEQPREPAASEPDDQELEDQVAALLNRDRASGGGAKRSEEQAALGGRQTTGQKLTQSETDAIIAQLRSCWNVPIVAQGSTDQQTVVRFRLDPTGTLEGSPAIEKASGNRQFDESTVRAIRLCSQRGFQLPNDKYDTWSEVVVNFDPRDMF